MADAKETAEAVEKAAILKAADQQAAEAAVNEDELVSKAQNPDAVRKLIDTERAKARDAERKARERAEAKVKEYEDAQKSEQQKLAEERDTLKGDAEKATKEAMRLRVALDKGLPPELIDRLKGDTLEELETDAEKLRELLPPPEARNFDGGARRPATEVHTDDPKEALGVGLLHALDESRRR